MIYSSIILTTAFIADLIFGDPKKLPHPISAIGALISGGEDVVRQLFPKDSVSVFCAGALLSCFVILVSYIVPYIILAICYKINLWLWLIVNIIFCWQIIAIKSLKDAAYSVMYELQHGNLGNARKALSMIVGRDTAHLSESGIIKASVETVAENSSDGVIAPLFFIMLGGAPLGFAYKALNTLDSMIGYKNDKYYYFGKFAARLDDIVNIIPSRVTAVLYIAAAFVLRYDYKNALRIFLRDRYNHSSPNSAQIESACAGALGIKLGGPSFYFGERVVKKTIGDEQRPPRPDDIRSAVNLLYISSFLALCIFVAVLELFNA